MELKDALSDEEREQIERKEKELRREGTKYGNLINDENA